MTARPSYITMNTVNRSNSNGMDDDVIHSLGKVLSSVNLVGEDHGMNYGGRSNGQQQQNMQHQQQQGGQSTPYYGSNSWNGAPGSSSSG
jgi:hypothetical protein